MRVEQSIKVTAKGEFTQLARGLKDLQRDLDGVTNQIDKATKKGGIFGDGSELAALDLYRKRFAATMDEVDKEFDKQNKTIDAMEARMSKASDREQQNIRQEIKQREKKLDVLRQEIMAMDRIYKQRNTESSSYTMKPIPSASPGLDPNGINDKMNSGVMGKIMKSTAGRALSMGKMGLGLAGIGGIGAVLSQAYQSAYQREVGSLDVAQRVRGSSGYSGSNTNIYDQMQSLGMQDKMGYNGADVGGFVDSYSRRAGVMSQSGTESMLKFSRGYGLDLGETAGAVSDVQRQGGASSPQKFADMIAASVGKSGMTPRIMEVMQTNAELLQTINTTLKDGQSTQILAYQTTLDKLGNDNHMSKLTGQSGAGIISGLNGIYSPGNDQWKWMGIRALQSYDPKKYGKKDLYGMETSFEDGLGNADNLPAMMKYIKKIGGNDQTLEKRMLQKWLQQGGNNATKQQVNDLYTVTDGMTAFDKDKMATVTQQLQGGDASAAYKDSGRQDSAGQNILDVEAQYKKALQGVGSEFLGIVTELKKGAAEVLDIAVKGFDAVENGLKAMEDTFSTWLDGTLKKLGVPDDTRKKITDAATNIADYAVNNPGETAAVATGVATTGWAAYKGGKTLWDKMKPKPESTTPGIPSAADSAAGAVESSASKVATGVLDASGNMIYKDATTAATDVATEAGSGWWSKMMPKNWSWSKIGTTAAKGVGEGVATGVVDAASDPLYHAWDWTGAGKNGELDGKTRIENGVYGMDWVNKKSQLDPKSPDYFQNDKRYKEEYDDIQSLSKDGTTALTSFEDKGDVHLKNMEDSNQTHLDTISKTTKEAMDNVYNEHKGFKTLMSWMFQPAVDHLKNLSLTPDSGGSSGGTGGSSWTGQYGDIINKAAKKYGMDPKMIAAVIDQESSFNTDAVSKSGAQGLMQLMPSTGLGLGVTDPFDPEQNIMGGTKYLADLYKKYGGDQTKALTAYNAGDGNVDKWISSGLMAGNSLDKVPFAESKDYAPSVLKKYAALSGRANGSTDMNQLVNAVTPSDGSSSQVSGGSNSTLTINLTMDPTTSQNLSNQQTAAIEKIAKQVFETAMKMKVQVNPSTTGR